jgi:hypothetical protein
LATVISHCWAGIEDLLPPENIFVTESDLRRKWVAYAALAAEENVKLYTRTRSIAEERFDERRMVDSLIDVITSLRAV